MTTQPEAIRQSELLNQLVINRDTMEELGRVEVLWMYAPSHRVLGFISKSGLLGAKKQAFKLSQVVALGNNGVLTHSPPEETNAEKVAQLETVLQCEIWSDTGQKVGKVTDYEFRLRSGEITKYLFVSSRLDSVTGELYQLFPSQITSIGRRRILVPDYVAQNLSIYREGIKQKLTKAGEFIKEEKTQVTEELKSLTRRAQETTQQVKGRFWNIAGQLKERAQSLSHQAQETIQSLGEQLQEETEILVDQARHRSQDWAAQVKEQTQTFSEQVEDGFQTLTIQAKEILDTDDLDASDSVGDRTDDDDLDEYFDNLFNDDDVKATGSGSPPPPSPPSESLRSPSTEPLEEPPIAPMPSPSSTSTSQEPSVPSAIAPDPPQELDDFSFDDFWDEPLIPSRPAVPPPSPTPRTPPQPSFANEENEDDDEPWI